MKLYLIGLPGSGKSFLGKQLADEMSLPFVDLDEVIEREQGTSIAEIFSGKGEDYFRSLEAAALRQQSKKTEFVMACGGGTPCFYDNMKFINESGLSLFINASLSEILNRMNQQQTKTRPLLSFQTEQSLKIKLEKLQQKRRSVYNQADIIIKGSNVPIKTLIEKIKSFRR